MQEIKIDSLTEAATKYGNEVKIQSGKNKYHFYSTKKDGNKTKAYEQYKLYRYQVGDVVKAEIDEKQRSFVDDKGKTVNYTDRKIMYFAEVEGAPDFDRPKEVPVVNIDSEIVFPPENNNEIDTLPF